MSVCQSVTHTNLQKAKITQYVQHSHLWKTKKDRETDALQWTANAGGDVSQGNKTSEEKHTHTNLQKARIHQYISHAHCSNRKNSRATEALAWAAVASVWMERWMVYGEGVLSQGILTKPIKR